MAGTPLARQIMDRVLPGGLAKWFEDHDGMPARERPAALAETELIDGKPFGARVHQRTLRDWRSALTDKPEEQR